MFRSAAAADTAAEDGEEDEAANAAGDTDDDRAVVVDPIADLFGGGGSLTLTLEKDRKLVFSGKVQVIVGQHTFEHLPPPPQGVPSRKFCCIL